MLPDLPDFKSKLDQLLANYFRARVDAKMGVFSQSPKHVVHEGEETEIRRSDGSSEIMEIRSASTEWTVNKSEVPTLSLEDRLAKLDLAADEMAMQITTGLFESLAKSLDAAGRTVSGGGKPFDVEAVFLGLDSVEWTFNLNGDADQISIVLPPQLQESARKVLANMQSDSLLQHRYAALVSKKRMEWREREAARKLVG